jgi:carbon-monoxide dehydrogenase large subunit
MTAFVLGLPEHKVRVIAPDVGGGFGAKIYLYAEDVCLTWASKKLNRNIKWNCDRSEAFLSDAHGRDHSSHAELAIDKDGKFLALRVHTDANLGAYLSTFSTAVPTMLKWTLGSPTLRLLMLTAVQVVLKPPTCSSELCRAPPLNWA